MYDPSEAVAFLNYPLKISADGANDSLKLYLFKAENQVQYIESRKELGPKVQLNFKSVLKNFHYSFVNAKNVTLLYQKKSEDKKSVVFWFKEIPKTNLQMVLMDGNLYKDTITVEIDSLNSKMKLALESPLERKNPYFKLYKIKFNRPIANFDTGKIQLFEKDSSQISYRIQQDSVFPSTFYIMAHFLEDSSYHITLLKGAFTDIYQHTSDSIAQSFKIDNKGEYSNLSVNIVESNSKAMVLQLTDSKEKVLDWSVVGKTPIVFQHLKAGDYGLKLIFDENENRQWDSGNLLKRISPEKVWIYQDKITLRSNWDQEIKWVIKSD